MSLSIFLISTALLAYEIILMRIFSITQWHHFAYMIISIALLGFGASGTFVSVFRARLLKRYLFYYRVFSCFFPLSIFLSYYLSQRNRFNPFEIAWNPGQYWFLVEYYLVLFVPFFLAATCIGLLFTRDTEKIGRLYSSNLIGSGCGALGVMGCLQLFHPVLVLYIIVGIACCGAVIAFSDGTTEAKLTLSITQKIILLLLIFGMLPLLLKYDPLSLRAHLTISQYKGLSLARNFPEAQLLTESVSSLGVVHTISSPIIRKAPGISLNYTGTIPSQIALFVDSENAGVISPEKNLDYLDFLPVSLVYHVRPASSALILGAGGGTDVLNALYHGVAAVEAVELNPDIISLVQGRFYEFTSGVYLQPNVSVINQEARGFIESTHSVYDVIQLSLLDSFGASSAGVHALNENYLYTIEAIQQYYSHLTPQGMLSITRWVKFPPRDNLKLFATAVEALEGLGIQDVSQRLISIRSWATSTLLLSKTPFTTEEIAAVRMFCQNRSFDTNYFPGITPGEANRYNQLPSAEYYRSSQALLFGEKEDFYASYPYYIKPARDNSPYFFHFFKWKSLTTLLGAMGRDWIPFVEWGYLVLLATLLQAAIVSLLLILLPLLTLSNLSIPGRYKGSAMLYFFSVGFGYLFIEMVCIQKFTLFLANPVSAVSVVIASFLFFSGLGSYFFDVWSAGSLRQVGLWLRGLKRVHRHVGAFDPLLLIAISGIIGMTLLYNLLLPSVFSWCAGWNSYSKVLLSILVIAPVAFCMGIPFPFGLKHISRKASELVPWAYGINGYASVLSSLIATGIAISSGFLTVFILADLFYMIAAGVLYRSLSS